MEEVAQNYLAEQPIGRLMRKYAVPCIISLLVGALYNIVDQIFIANASYLGSFGNAANTVVFPLTVIALAVSWHVRGWNDLAAVHRIFLKRQMLWCTMNWHRVRECLVLSPPSSFFGGIDAAFV